MDWHDQRIAELRQLWAEGHATAEIGRRMGISKNAVVGKAKRLELPGRPSPIVRSGVPSAAAIKRAGKETLSAIGADQLRRWGDAAPQADAHTRVGEAGADAAIRWTGAASVAGGLMAPPTGRPPAEPIWTAPAAASKPPVLAGPRRFQGLPCCWPIGEPGAPGFRFCDAPAAAGRPYCDDHVRVAYVKLRTREDEAAA